MKIFKRGFFLLLLAKATLQVCSDGCLVCSSTGQCKLCDLSSFYIPQVGSCVKREVQNCLYINQSGDCLECEDGFFYNLFERKCLELELKKKIDNCVKYKNALECEKCAKNYFLKGGVCEKVSIQVPGCSIQNTSHCK